MSLAPIAPVRNHEQYAKWFGCDRVYSQRKLVSSITIQARKILTMSPCITKFQKYECGRKSAWFSNEKASIDIKTYTGTYTNWCISHELLCPLDKTFSHGLYINMSSLLECPHFEIDIHTNEKESILLLNLVPRTDVVLYPDYVERFYKKANNSFYKRFPNRMRQHMIENIYDRVSLYPMGVVLGFSETEYEEVETTVSEFFNVFVENLEKSLDDILDFDDNKISIDKSYLDKRDAFVMDTRSLVFDRKISGVFEPSIRKDIVGIMKKEKSVFID